MNWVGGIRKRLKLQHEKKLQKEFFERRRLQSKRSVFGQNGQNPKGRRSQDLLAVRTASKAHSSLPKGVYEKPSDRFVQNIDLDKFQSSRRIVREVEMPLSLSPGTIPSKISLHDVQNERDQMKVMRTGRKPNKHNTAENTLLIPDMPDQSIYSKEQTQSKSTPSVFITQPLLSKFKSNSTCRLIGNMSSGKLRVPCLDPILEEPPLLHSKLVQRHSKVDMCEDFQATPLMKYYHCSSDGSPFIRGGDDDNQIVPYLTEKENFLPQEESASDSNLPSKITVPSLAKYVHENLFMHTPGFSRNQFDQNAAELQRKGIKSVSKQFSHQVAYMGHRYNKKPRLTAEDLFPDCSKLPISSDNLDRFNAFNHSSLHVWSPPIKRKKLKQRQISAVTCSPVRRNKINFYGRISPSAGPPSLFFRHRYVNTEDKLSVSDAVNSKHSPIVREYLSGQQKHCQISNVHGSRGLDFSEHESISHIICSPSQRDEELSCPIFPEISTVRVSHTGGIQSTAPSTHPEHRYSDASESLVTGNSSGADFDFCVRSGCEENTECQKVTNDTSTECLINCGVVNTSSTTASEENIGCQTTRSFESEMSFLQTLDKIKAENRSAGSQEMNKQNIDEILSELSQLESQQAWHISEVEPNETETLLQHPTDSKPSGSEIVPADNGDNNHVASDTGSNSQESFETASAGSDEDISVEQCDQLDSLESSAASEEKGLGQTAAIISSVETQTEYVYQDAWTDCHVNTREVSTQWNTDDFTFDSSRTLESHSNSPYVGNMFCVVEIEKLDSTSQKVLLSDSSEMTDTTGQNYSLRPRPRKE